MTLYRSILQYILERIYNVHTTIRCDAIKKHLSVYRIQMQ